MIQGKSSNESTVPLIRRAKASSDVLDKDKESSILPDGLSSLPVIHENRLDLLFSK